MGDDRREKHRLLSIGKAISVGIGFGALYWILESAADVLMFDTGYPVERILTPGPHEIWMRSLVVCILIAFAVYAQFMTHEHKRTEAERDRLLTALKHRSTQLQTAAEVSRSASAILDPKELMNQAVNLIQERFDFYYIGLFLVDEVGKYAMLRAGTGDAGRQMLEAGHRLVVGGESMIGWSVANAKARISLDVGKEAVRFNNPYLPETRSEMALPLISRGQCIGALTVQSTEEAAFLEEDITVLQSMTDHLAIAIENARLYEEERKRVNQLELIGGITQKIASILDLDELLPQVAHLVGDTFGYYKINIFLVEANRDELILRAVYGPCETQIGRLRLKINREGITGWVAHSGEPLLVEDVSREPRYYSTEESKDTKSELAVPIRLQGEIIGVLDVQSAELNGFSKDDVFILQTLADQIAVAIENARLYKETVRRLEEAETLGAVSTTLTRSLNLDQVLQTIVDSATRLILTSTSGVIHLVDEAAGKLTPRATSPGVNVQKSMEMSIGEGIAGLVMQENRLINVPDVEKDPRFLSLDTDTPKRSLLTAPLLIDGDCIGTISLNSDQRGAFTSDDERLLTTLAAQAAVAVRNARLHQEVQRRVEELTFLNRVGRAVTSSLDLEQILKTVMQETARVLGTEAGSILLLDEDSNELVFEAAVGPRSGMKGLRLPLGQGIAGWVVREGQRLLVPNVSEDPRFYSGIDEVTGFITRSVLAVPLKVKGIVIGVIEAVNKTEGYFGQADVALVSSIAQWAAIAIENAQLFAETRRRFEEMAALHDVSLDITARLEMPELLKSIVERAVGLLRADAGGVYLYEQERKEWRLAIGYNYVGEHLGVTLEPRQGMAGKISQTGETFIVDDNRTWRGRAAVFEANQPFTAALEVPLKWHERITGVLAIDADVQKRTFNQDDVWLATLFANQAAIAIENARLYEELQDRMEELKRTQAQLIQSAKLAAIGELAAGVAHEINNPLTSIMGFTRLLLQEVQDEDPMKEDLQIIDLEAARAKAIVKALLDFARQRETQLKPADVNEIVRNTVTLVRHQAKGARVTIRESYDKTLPLVSLDADQIKQVFLNIITNAIQAMPEGGELKVVTAYWPQARSPELVEARSPALAGGTDGADCVVVEFHDTGTGISVENLPRIFDPFFTTKEVGHGTGLGLSISYGIVEKHGGKIEVESEVGRGSTFTVMLPVTANGGKDDHDHRENSGD